MQYVGRNCETRKWKLESSHPNFALHSVMNVPCSLVAAAPVMTEPTSVLIPEIVYVPIFSQAVFVCQVTGSPQPSIEWFKDDVIIPNEESQFLIVPSVTLSDRGKYYCTVTNTLGTDISNTGYLGIYGQYT